MKFNNLMIITQITIDVHVGRMSFKQYVPLKPVRCGFKVWVRADSTGYVSEFDVYTGKGTGVDDDELGLGENLVMKLT